MMITKTAFDTDAHLILTQLLDDTEHRLAQHGDCAPNKANDVLCRHYIDEIASIMFGAQWHTNSDERIGVGIFLSKLHGGKRRLRSGRTERRCVQQLLNYTNLYFPNYVRNLTVLYLAELQQLESHDRIMMNGLMKLAAKDIAGARADIRRKMRLLPGGQTYAIVDDATMERALARLSGDLLSNTLDMVAQS